MRNATFVATAVLAAVVAAAPLASAQNRQRWPSQGDNGNRGGSQQRGGGGEQRGGGSEQRGGGQRVERQAQPREGARAQAPRAEQGDRGRREATPQAGRREIAPQERGDAAPQERREPRVSAQGNDGNRRAGDRRDGRNDGRSIDRYAVGRTGPAPRYRDGDRRVYAQPRRNYYVYRYPSYRYYGSTRYYGYRYYDPYFAGDFYWSNHSWRPRTYYVGSNYDYDLGKLRLDIDQRDAEVYIDGYYAGVVDEFDGVLQGLQLESGNYSVEVALPGFEPLQFDVHVTPGRTTTYRGDLLPERP
jgi:hypothetical protein